MEGTFAFDVLTHILNKTLAMKIVIRRIIASVIKKSNV